MDLVPRPLRLALAAIVVSVVITEISAYGLIALSRGRLSEDIRRRSDLYADQREQMKRLLADDPHRRLALDPVLGWRYTPGHRSATDTISSQGLRASRLYSARPAPHVRRVAAFGDSFVYASEVADDHAWPAVLERRAPSLEVLNYGVGGYGVDQAYLRYRMEGHHLEPHVVIMGFVPDDLRRVVNMYRRFLSANEPPLVKPRFSVSPGGDLVLLPMPDLAEYARYLTDPRAVRELGVHDRWYEPLVYESELYEWSATVRLGAAAWIRARRRYVDPGRLIRGGQFSERSEAFTIQLRLFQRFADDVRRASAQPVVVFFPDRAAVTDAVAGTPPVYLTLLRATEASQIPVVDLAPAFTRAAEDGIAKLFMSGGHYSPAGNAVAADTLARELGRLSSTR